MFLASYGEAVTREVVVASLIPCSIRFSHLVVVPLGKIPDLLCLLVVRRFGLIGYKVLLLSVCPKVALAILYFNTIADFSVKLFGVLWLDKIIHTAVHLTIWVCLFFFFLVALFFLSNSCFKCVYFYSVWLKQNV